MLAGSSGASSASRVQLNTCWTSTYQLVENVRQVWCWIGRERRRAGVEHDGHRLVGVYQLAGDGRVCGVGDDRHERFAELGLEGREAIVVAGDADHAGTGGAHR